MFMKIIKKIMIKNNDSLEGFLRKNTDEDESIISEIIDRLERSIRKTTDQPEFNKGVRHALAVVKKIAGCEDE